MVFTDTPDAAFDFENFNGHHGSITYYLKQNHIYPYHLLTKYSLAIPLKCTTAIDIIDAFTSEFIYVSCGRNPVSDQRFSSIKKSILLTASCEEWHESLG